ncbi:MAG: hypothetical protein DELT_02764 [Desulfovibrio sp.]
MNSITRFLLCLALTAPLALPLAGCALLDPGPPMAQVILPVQMPVAAQANRMPVQILVAHPVTDAATGTDRILALMHGFEIKALDSAKWASPIPWIVQRLLIDSLESSLRFGAVGWEESSMDASIRLSTDLRRFFLRYDGGEYPVADVALILTLTDMTTSKVFARTIITGEQRCAGNNVKEFVAAFSSVMAKVLSESNEWTARKVEEHLQ